MRDPLLVTDVRLHGAPPADVRRGLLGFVSCTLGGKVRLDGLTLRRSLEGRLYVAFPRPRDARGRGRATVRPIDEFSQREIETQILLSLGIRLEAAP
jgi:hypothetical protein